MTGSGTLPVLHRGDAMAEEHTAAALRRPLQHAPAGGRDEAHRSVRDLPGPAAARLRAQLHRAEGDPADAACGYRRAERPVCEGTLASEVARIAAAPTAPAAP